MKTIIRSIITVLSLTGTLMIHAQVPLLNSYPSAEAVIFLDFDGHTVNGTSWNYNGPIVCGTAGLDNSKIIEIYSRVAEDYRPFNLNITTDSSKFLAAPSNRRMRVILTVSSSWYGTSGGVAFINSFSWGDDNPCFVFSALLNYNVKNIAEAASHEAGHTLGLYHQSSYDANCTKLSDYYAGQGSGEIGWAPIMGVGYYRNFTLWNNGPNSYGCNSLQNDLDIITSSNNGFGYRTDDHFNSFDGSTIVSFPNNQFTGFSNNQFTVSGVIERNTDQDMFRFIVPATGRFQLDAIPYNVGSGNSGSDLDLQVTLYDNTQTILNTYNPGTLLSSLIDSTLAAGTYYLKIEGRGNQYAPAYASLGSYSLLGRTTPGTSLAVQRLELNGQLDGNLHKLNWVVEADELIVKQTLEVSTDGRNFQSLTQPLNDERSYAYNPNNTTPAQYRLKVIFTGSREYYSNTVTIWNNTPRPKLRGSIAGNNQILVTSPGDYDYWVVDMNGKTILKGKLINGANNISLNGVASGLYMIRFADNRQYWTDKFLVR